MIVAMLYAGVVWLIVSVWGLVNSFFIRDPNTDEWLGMIWIALLVGLAFLSTLYFLGVR